MKASKTKYLIIAVLALFAAFQMAACVFNLYSRGVLSSDGHIGCDLELRYNEVRCAHQGVNSFRVWNHEITLFGFAPAPRPDKEVIGHEDDARVHAYPPWHIIMFWFYGWLSKEVCFSLMSVVLGFCLCFICYESARLTRERFKPWGYITAFSLILITYNVSICFLALNYSVLILAMFLLMNRILSAKRYDIFAGLVWAIMMIKPQVGLLFVWPLFWKKHYLTIATAIVVCLAATFGVSIFVKESMLDLILQIPKIGQPYVQVPSELLQFIAISYSKIPFLFPAIFFVIVGITTWYLRKQDFLNCCVPVMLIIPIWTYSIPFDWAILLPVFILLIGRISIQPKLDSLSIISIFYALSMTILALIVSHISFFDRLITRFLPIVASEGVFYSIKYANWVLTFTIILLFVYEKHRELRAAGCTACKAC